MESDRIIIAESGQDSSDGLKQSLLNLGCVVSAVVPLGDSLLHEVKKYRPDLVIVDIGLWSNKGGVEIACQIENQFDIPILFLISQAKDAIPPRVINSPLFGYRCKPVNEESLRISVQTLFTIREMGRKLAETEASLFAKDSYLQLLQITSSFNHEEIVITDVFQQVMDEICQTFGWQVGQTFFVTKDSFPVLRSGIVWTLQDEKRFKKFCSLTKEMDFAHGTGLPGRVLAFRKPQWVIDVTKDRNFIRANIAKELLLKSAMAFPVKVGSKVVAVLEFLSTDKKGQDSQFMKVVDTLGIQLGWIVEGKENRSELEKFKFFSDNSNDIHLLFDRELRFLYANKIACEKLGYLESELLELSVPDIDDLFESKNYSEVFHERKEKRVLIFETRNKREDGTIFPCEVTLKSIFLDGQPYAFAVLKDLTESKQLEEALLRSEKTRTLGVISSGVAHMFNNILTIISSNAQLLEEKYRFDKELSKPLRTICRVVEEGAVIVDRMYEFANVEDETSGYKNVDMGELLKQTIEYTKPRWKEIAQARGVTYRINQLAIQKVPAVWGDTTELREVLVNIINNALDAMPDGGTLSFRAWSENDRVCTSISDTGMGMSQDDSKKLFDSFFTTKRFEGTGLGMAISSSIISKHGGTIDVESERGRGCTIVINLPIAEKISPSGSPVLLADKINVKEINILVIDDEKDICESLSDFFALEGFHVKSVRSGRDAAELIKNNGFDLLICDLVMPNINGKELIKMLDTVPVEKRPKVGLMTGWKYGLEDAKEEGLNVDFVINKPFDFSKLRKDLNAVLGAG